MPGYGRELWVAAIQFQASVATYARVCVERKSDLFFWARKGEPCVMRSAGSLCWCPLDPQFHCSFGETDGTICSALLRFWPDRWRRRGTKGRNGSDWSGRILYWVAQWVWPPFAFAFVPHLDLIAPPWRPAGFYGGFFFVCVCWPDLLTNWKTVCVCDSVQFWWDFI